jgi:hypothetical protein
VGPQLLEEFLDTGFAVGAAGRHGVRPGVRPRIRVAFAALVGSYQKARDFSLTFPEHTRGGHRPPIFLDRPAADDYDAGVK